MKRKWRIGRVVVALCLFVGAGIIERVWPRAPSCRLPSEFVIGFDEGRNLVWTNSTPMQPVPLSRPPSSIHLVLRGYDLHRGDLRHEAALVHKPGPRSQWPFSAATLL